MELDNDYDKNSVELMEIEYSVNSIETDDDYENFLFQQLPIQTNQNSSTTTTIPCFSNVNFLKKNLIFESIILKSQINRNNHINKEIIHPKKMDIPIASFTTERKLISINEKTSHSNFEYDSQYVEMHREKNDLNTNFDWLNFRLKINSSINDYIQIDQMIISLKSTFLNTVIDLMIYYHTTSDFALQLFNVEALNLLIILKHPKLLEIAESLTNGFSKDLLSLIRKIQSLQEAEGLSECSFPIIAETMMNNYFQIKTFKRSLKLAQHNFPKIVYFSFYMPTFMLVDGININRILNKKMISLQRKFNCKIIFNGPFMRNLSPSTKNEYFHFEIFFDFNVNYWFVVIQEFIKYINSFTRCISECHIDKVCVGYVSGNFFCCDEIKNLMKRHLLLREMDTEFVNLIKWVQLNRLDRSNL